MLRYIGRWLPALLLATQTGAAEITFERDVAPLLAHKCLDCHSGAEPEGGLDLARKAHAQTGGDSGAALEPGDPAASYLWQRVSADEMPPDEPLTDSEKEVLRQWIDSGAEWTVDPIDPLAYSGDGRAGNDWWSLQPIERPPVSDVQDSGFVRNPIDRFVAAELAEHGLTPSSRADRRTLLRRLSLDLLGLPPTYEEIADFEQDDAPDAWEHRVDRMLASPHFGERWARHWLDVVRFAESNGFETNHERPAAYHYRDYVIRAINEDKPYDRFVFEQLAGDAVEAHAATGFIVGGPTDIVKGQDPLLGLMQRQDELTDMVNTTGTAFMGLTLGCARCHNHKFDPVTQADFYSLQAVFAGVQHDNRRIERARSPEDEQRVAELERRRGAIVAELDRLTASLQSGSGGAASPAAGETLIVDDEDLSRVEILRPKQGHGVNPEGTGRGQRQDPGGAARVPNVSGGRYTWWQPATDADVFAYRPGVQGEFRVWLSWGCGWSTHAADARYYIDEDGDLATQADQQLIATVDQQRFADGTGEIVSQPLWSGFYDAGLHVLQEQSRIVVRCGRTGTAITADAIVLQRDAAPSTQPRLQPAVTPTRNEERFAPVLARRVRFTIRAVNNGIEPCLDELEIWSAPEPGSPSINVALAANGATAQSSGDYSGNPKHRLEHIFDGQYGNDRSWIAGTVNEGWVEIELPQPVRIERIVWQRDRNGQYADRTPVDYSITVSETADREADAWRVVAASSARAPFGSPGDDSAFLLAAISPERSAPIRDLLRKQAAVDAELSALREPVTMYAGRFAEPPETRRLYRGDPLSPREEVAPAVLSVLQKNIPAPGLSPAAAEQQRRVTLAEWLIDPRHPLTARVIVNRVWQQHFGEGLVSTPSDFGAMGAPPTHPELLDWLAAELIDSGWSLKHIHRLILTSATYQQSNTPRPDCMAVDATSSLLWRFPPRRLEAEAIRDSIIAVSGRLDPAMYGPGYLMFEPNSNYARNWVAKDEFGPGDFRRMVYALKLRMENDAVFGAFDCPDAGQVMPARSRSTTPLQALNLLNSSFISEQAATLARQSNTDQGDGIVAMFRLTLARDPDAVEREAAETLAGRYGLDAVARALFNSNEFLFIP